MNLRWLLFLNLIFLIYAAGESALAQVNCSDTSFCSVYDRDGRCVMYYKNCGPATRPTQSYGAIAYSASSGAYGYSEKYANRAQAESRAKQECGKNDCEIAAWYFNSCGALAADDDGPWGGAQGADEQGARQTALARCEKEGGRNCKVIATQCSQ